MKEDQHCIPKMNFFQDGSFWWPFEYLGWVPDNFLMLMMYTTQIQQNLPISVCVGVGGGGKGVQKIKISQNLLEDILVSEFLKWGEFWKSKIFCNCPQTYNQETN